MTSSTRAPGPAVRPTAGPGAFALRIAIVAGVWLLALAGTIALRDFLARANFAVFWIAILFAAWYAGFAAAFASAVLAVVAVEYFVAEPRHGFSELTPATIVTLAIFIGVSGLVSALVAGRGRAQRAADTLAGELQEQAVELEAQMEEAQTLTEDLAQTNAQLESAVEEMDAARRASGFLAEASRLLSVSLDYESTLRAVADAAVPTLGDWCAVDVVRDPTSATWPPQLDRVAAAYRDPAMADVATEFARRFPTDWSAPRGMARVLRDREPLFVPQFTDGAWAAIAQSPEHLAVLRRLEISSAIIVPLVARDTTFGAITLVVTDPARHYGPHDLGLARDLAHRAAVAIDNARLFREADRARHDAEGANRAKSQFLSTMSHELRTPLNAIIGYVELLELGLRGPLTDQQREDLTRMRRSARLLNALVSDVLNFARVEAGRLDLRPAPVPIARVLAELAAMLAPEVAQKGLTYDDAGCGDDVLVFADPDRVRQIVTNLLINAIKFTPNGGRIAVACDVESVPDMVRVRVTDTGRGIPHDRLSDIFEPFVQVDRHLTHESQQGVGLGLAISRELARAMGGDLTAESVLGDGAVFELTLPRVHASP